MSNVRVPPGAEPYLSGSSRCCRDRTQARAFCGGLAVASTSAGHLPRESGLEDTWGGSRSRL